MLFALALPLYSGSVGMSGLLSSLKLPLSVTPPIGIIGFAGMSLGGLLIQRRWKILIR
jgi:xanthosine utilization system XapX-like protein